MRAALVVVLLSLAVVILAQSSCPNKCSGHGTCSSGKCNCQSGWAGEDCSEAITPLSANRPVSGTVGARLWLFYSYLVARPGSTLTWSVNQTGNAGDCDLYLKAGSIPTRFSYDLRDIGTGSSMTLVIPNSKATTYYAGVYGYTGCSFTAGVYLPGGGTSNCPNACSNHGSCSSSGTCNCNTGWSGSDCSTSLNQLAPSRPIVASVDAASWNYYTWNISTSVSVATVTVNQTSSTADCDLYIRSGSLPTRFIYDYSDKTSDQNFALSIMQPGPGAWYAGVTGFTACSYTITLTLNTQSCPPGACSGHGSCRSNSAVCVCSPGYSGGNCETMLAPLTAGQLVSGYAASSNAFNYYKYLAFSADNIIVSLTRQGGSGSCALYAKSRANPSSFNYDYMSAASSDSLSLTVPDPGQSIWYFGVSGFLGACNYTLSITDSVDCPNSCSGNGQCFEGTCLCNSGYSGDDCSVNQVTLTPGNVISGSVASGEWMYYALRLPASASVSSITIALHETSSTGSVWVFVSEQLTASLRQYDHADTSEKASHVIHFERTPPTTSAATMYSIGVYGSPFSPETSGVSYTITAWYPSI